jgi:hypothetical protein
MLRGSLDPEDEGTTIRRDVRNPPVGVEALYIHCYVYENVRCCNSQFLRIRCLLGMPFTRVL